MRGGVFLALLSIGRKIKNISPEELLILEAKWEQEGKTKSRRRYLRYYYRNRERYLNRKSFKKADFFIEEVITDRRLII